MIFFSIAKSKSELSMHLIAFIYPDPTLAAFKIPVSSVKLNKFP